MTFMQRSRINGIDQEAPSMETRPAGTVDRVKPLMLVLVIACCLASLVLSFGSVNFLLAKAFSAAKNYEAADSCYSNSLVSHILFKQEALYAKAGAAFERENYQLAAELYRSMGDYKDAMEMANVTTYQCASDLAQQKHYDEAIALFTQLGDYRDSASRLLDTQKEKGLQYIQKKAFAKAIDTFEYLKGKKYNGADELIQMAHYKYGQQYNISGDYINALKEFRLAGNYAGAEETYKITLESAYQATVVKYLNAYYLEAKNDFDKLIEGTTPYKDSALYSTLCAALEEVDWENINDAVIKTLIFDKLLPIIQLPEASDMALYDTRFSDAFLMGTWVGGSKYMTVDKDGTTTDLPFPNGVTHFTVERGTWSPYGDKIDKTPMWKVSIISRNQITVNILASGKTYTMYRQ